MARNVAQKLIESHLVSGEMHPGAEIALSVDQTLTQDATGTMVMLELEALGLDRVRTDVSVQYVDHNLLQADSKNADDHLFLRSACRRFGLWYSKPGNGVSHPTHMQRFGVPGQVHGRLGQPHPRRRVAGHAGDRGRRPRGRHGHRRRAALPADARDLGGRADAASCPPGCRPRTSCWRCSAGTASRAAVNRIIEYHGAGLAHLTAMDRHVIANMGAELGATTTVFPADDPVRAFLRTEQREDDFTGLRAEPAPPTTSPRPSTCPRWNR